MEEIGRLILGTFLGALLAIVGGLLVNQSWRQRVDKERRKQLLAAMKGAIAHNFELLNEISRTLSDTAVPSFSMNLCLLDATASLKYELLDTALCADIDRARFDLAHLSRKLDVALGLQTSTNPGATQIAHLEQMKHSIKVQLDMIRETLTETQSKL